MRHERSDERAETEGACSHATEEHPHEHPACGHTDRNPDQPTDHEPDLSVTLHRHPQGVLGVMGSIAPRAHPCVRARSASA